MKITTKQLRNLIREALLVEKPHDYYKDYRAGNISYEDYQQLVRDFENKNSGQSWKSPSATPPVQPYTKPEKLWTGTPKELEKRVHQYLIDIGFYLEAHNGWVNPFTQGDHPAGGYTSNIPKVIKKAITDGDIDWATWEEIQPTYRKIDRSID